MDSLAIGTLVLALATVWLAWFTHRLAQASAEQVALLRQELQQGSRPILVPASSAERVPYRGGVVHDAGAGPAVAGGALIVPLENVGAGTALNVRGELHALLGSVPWGAGSARYPIEGIRAGGYNALTFATDSGDVKPFNELEIRLRYTDVGGLPYWSSMSYDKLEGGYHCETGEGELPEHLRLRERKYVGTP